jgi:hypothetical protein
MKLFSFASYDFVEILEDNRPPVGPFCNSNLPSPYISTSNIVSVRFKSDNLLANKGFRISYKLDMSRCYLKPGRWSTGLWKIP